MIKRDAFAAGGAMQSKRLINAGSLVRTQGEAPDPLMDTPTFYSIIQWNPRPMEYINVGTVVLSPSGECAFSASDSDLRRVCTYLGVSFSRIWSVLDAFTTGAGLPDVLTRLELEKRLASIPAPLSATPLHITVLSDPITAIPDSFLR